MSLEKKFYLVHGSVIMILVAIIIGGCVDRRGLQDAVKINNDRIGSARKLTAKTVQVINGYSTTYLPSTGEFVYMRLDERGDSWLYLLKSGKEIKLFKGSSPFLTKVGLYFEGKQGISLWNRENGTRIFNLEGFSLVGASSDGEMLILEKSPSEEKSELYLYYRKEKRTIRIELPPDLYPFQPALISQNEILFSGGLNKIGAGEPATVNVYSVRISQRGGKSKPKLLLNDRIGAALSPKGKYFATFKYLGDRSIIEIYRFKDLKSIGFIEKTGDMKGEFYPAPNRVPLIWVSENRLVVEEHDQAFNVKTRVIEIGM